MLFIITFFIDESGKFNVTDLNQQISILACLPISNSNYKDTIEKINSLKDNLYRKIKNKVLSCTSVFNVPQKKVINKVLYNFINDKFELHMNKLWNGKDQFRFLSLNDKLNFINEIFQFLNDNELEIFILKFDIADLSSLSLVDKQEFINNSLSKCLLKTTNDYLDMKNDTGCLVIDDGNPITKDYFYKYFLENIPDLLSANIEYANSISNINIQLVDVIAYMINLNFKNELEPFLNQNTNSNNSAIIESFKINFKTYIDNYVTTINILEDSLCLT